MEKKRCSIVMLAALLAVAHAGCKDGTQLGVEDADPEFVVNTHGEGDQMSPVVVAMPSGQFMVVWESGCLDACQGQDGSEFGIYARRFAPSGLALSGEFRVNDQVDFNQRDPAAAMLPDGSFVIAWATEGEIVGDSWDIRVKFYNAEGVELTNEIAVNEVTLDTQWLPRVTLTEGGIALVIWEHHEGGGTQILGRRLDDNGAALGPSVVLSDDGWGGSAKEPGLAGLPDGRGVVVWAGGSGYGSSGVSAQRLDGDELVGDVVEVSAGVTATYPMPSVAMAPEAGFVVAWSGADGEGWDGYDIRARAFDADGEPLVQEIAVNQDASGLQMNSAVAVSPDGQRFVVSWDSEDEEGLQNVIAKVYDLTGAAVEADFVVNTYQADMQDSPSIAPTWEGFLVAWNSSPEQGTGMNVYVRLFPAWP